MVLRTLLCRQKGKKKKEQKIFMFEKIDSLFVVVVAINRTTASVISGVLIFIWYKSNLGCDF